MTAATTSAQHYQVRMSTRTQLPETIAAAYTAAGLTPPNQGAALMARLNAEPSAEQVALDLAAEAVEVTDADTWIGEALDRIQRAAASDQLRRAVAGHREHAMQTRGGILIRQATADLTKPIKAAFTKLTKAAADLTGDDPLSVESAVERDATAPRRAAIEALTLIGQCASVLGTIGARELHPAVRDLMYVVDVPEVGLEVVDRMTREPKDTDQVRDAIRLMADHAERQGVDRALIGVARREYGKGVRLTLAGNPTELHERLERVRIATSQIVGEFSRPSPARKPVVQL